MGNSFGKRSAGVSRQQPVRASPSRVEPARTEPRPPVQTGPQKSYREPARKEPIYAVPAAGEIVSAPDLAASPRIQAPYLTFAIVAGLSIVFLIERILAPEGDGLSLNAAVAMGGVSRNLVIASHQWWRIFTAPFLHGSLTHLAGNCFALIFAGFALERVIGARWYACVFMLSAIAGSIGSIIQSDPDTVSVGASGAISGVLACALVSSFHFESEAVRKRMRKYTLRFLMMALIPAILPETVGSGAQVDIGAHIGGALAGGFVGFLLREIWPDESPTPAFATGGASFAFATVLVAGFGFLLAAQGIPVPAPSDDTVALMQPQDLPADLNDAARHSAEIVQAFPHDPRAHILRAEYFFEKRDVVATESELRVAMSEQGRVKLSPAFDHGMHGLMASVLLMQGRRQEAAAEAQSICAANDLAAQAMREGLEKAHLCG